MLSWEMNIVFLVLRKGIFKLYVMPRQIVDCGDKWKGLLVLQRFRRFTLCTCFNGGGTTKKEDPRIWKRVPVEVTREGPGMRK